jgi:hypothetical protein
MNPEFQRNLWLEAGPRRLAWAGVALAAVYGAAAVLGQDGDLLQALGIAGSVVFVVAGLLWGPRIAGRAVGDEVAQRTWDFQRLSALDPWAMTWGKLFGATSLAWVAAASGLLFLAVSATRADGAGSALQVVVGGLGAAVLLQAGSMALALVGVRRARAEGRSAAFRFTFGGVIALFVVGSVIARTAPTGGARLRGPLSWLFGGGPDLHWWGLEAGVGWIAALSLAAFAGWAMLGAWRLMRLELQMRNFPWAWPLFTAFAGLWAAGFPHQSDAARWAAAGLVFAACAYASAFAEPAERVRLRQFGAKVRSRDYDAAAFDAPAVIAPVLFAAAAVLGLSLAAGGPGAPEPSLALAAFAFLLRDLGVVAYFRFGPRPRRGDFGAVVALFLAYFVGGVVGANLGGAQGMGLFTPGPSLVSAAAGFAMAAVAWVLAWRRIRAPEKSEG